MVISRSLRNGSSYSAEEEVSWEQIAQAKAGEHTAFESIYRMYVGRIYALSFRMLENREWAEDVAQRIFVRAWSKLSSFRGESRFSSWLYRLAINVILSELKSTHENTGEISRPANVQDQESTDPESQRVFTLDLEKAIALLPPQARLVFILHDIEGFTYAEISHAMGLAVGTCKAHLSRARKILRGALNL